MAHRIDIGMSASRRSLELSRQDPSLAMILEVDSAAFVSRSLPRTREEGRPDPPTPKVWHVPTPPLGLRITSAGTGSNHGNRIEGPMRLTKRDLASSIRLAFDVGYEAALNRAPQMELKIVRKATVDRLVIELMAIQIRAKRRHPRPKS
jgi:hypothetical protein